MPEKSEIISRADAFDMIDFLDTVMCSDRTIVMINGDVVEITEKCRKRLSSVIASFAAVMRITADEVDEYFASMDKDIAIH